jgi:uncharacterized membrane protein YhaH (DUF805 family)
VKGNIIGFDPDTNTGAISGHDGKRYDFVTADWHGQARPRQGDVVDFQPSGDRATQLYLVDAEYVQPSLGEFYFSPHGRISRSQYWLKFVLPVIAIEVVLIGLMGISAAAGSSGVVAVFSVVLTIFALAVLWPSIAIIIKRVHDRDWPWPFILLFLVPIVSIWPLIEIWFLRGTIGSNRFGADPVPRQ